MTRLHYLGPEGSFTHAAALENSARFERLMGAGMQPVAQTTARGIFEAVETSDDLGIIAVENNVEGYVVPNLDALIDSPHVVGIDRVGLHVTFDAFVRPGHGQLREVTAHPHGLAQCQAFIDRTGLTPVPATSNAAACKNLTDTQVGLGPTICGELYGLDTLESGVEDYSQARTDFLLIANREVAAAILRRLHTDQQRQYETIVTFIPLQTGPGVLATALDVMRDAGLNMTSFISRPIKGHDGTYSFIATLDAAPWEERFVRAVGELTDNGSWVKTLAVYERPERPSPPVETWMLPVGGVRSVSEPAAAHELFVPVTNTAMREEPHHD